MRHDSDGGKRRQLDRSTPDFTGCNRSELKLDKKRDGGNLIDFGTDGLTEEL
jgi:hypothetical protein